MTCNATHVPVLIIGGGIVGLSGSLFLADRSIQCMLIERHVGTSIHPRARSVNARRMELYRSIGIADAIREAGAKLATSVGIYKGTTLKSMIESKPRSEKKQTFPFMKLFSGIGPEPGTFGTQDMLEPVLLKYAKERGVDARFHTECLSVEQTVEKVTATLRNRDTGATYTITADYLIAADGANSPIRTQLGIERTGRGEIGNLLNILFHTTPSLGPLVKNREFSLCQIDQPEVGIAGLFTAINNAERWVFHLLYYPAKGEKPQDFPPERCVELLHQALGMGKDEVAIEVKSILPWQASVRIAERVQEGRIFLAGDSAHQMPPYAGQGANSGISDAHNLAWKLAAVLNGQASPSLLTTYEIERLPVGTAAAAASGSAADERGLLSQKKNLITMLNLARRLHIIAGFGYTYSSKAIIAESTWPLGGYTWRPWTIPSLFLSLDGRPGTRAPHVWVEKDGKKISTLDLLGKGFVLLAGSDGKEWVRAGKHAKLEAYSCGPDDEVVDPQRKWEAAAGIGATGVVLVRPDGFVAWRERRKVPDCEVLLGEIMKQILAL